MKLRIRNIRFPSGLKAFESLPEGLLLINTINAYSYNIARKDALFAEALLKSNVLLPDGASIVKAVRWLRAEKIERIAGWDLFVWEMKRLQTTNDRQQTTDVKTQHAKSVLFLGSTEAVLAKIKARAAVEYPNVEVHTYSPPYKPEFSDEDNQDMFKVIEAVQPDVLFVGMTAPKQEKWAWKLVNSGQLTVDSKKNKEGSRLNTANCKLNMHVCCIGAVFDFYAGTVKRAPLWWQEHSLEWLYRLIKEPRRMWRRYLVGNLRFVWYMVGERISSK